VIQRIDPSGDPQVWAQLAAIYTDYNTERPLTMIRSPDYWHGYAAWMLGEWIQNHRAVIFVASPASDSGDWCGYVVVHTYDAAYAQQAFGSPPWFFISEIGVRKSEREATTALLHAVAEEAKRQGMGYAQMTLPNDPPLNAALREMFGETLEEHPEMGAMMMRALSADAPEIVQVMQDSAAFFWSLDRV
jgi:hypothetical protein